MSAAPLGRLLGLVALLLFGIGFVTGSVGPPVAGLVLLSYLGAAGRGARVGHVETQRHVPPVTGLAPFTVTVEAHTDAPMPLRIEDPVLPGADVLEAVSRPGRGRAVLEMRVQAHAPGRLAWQETHVVSSDAWGLGAWRRAVAAPGETQVMPSAEAMVRGQRHGRRNPVQTVVKAPLATDPLPEFRSLRPYMPADRSRDIDWRASTRLGALVTRERERATPRAIIVLLDATRSMRRPARVPKMRTVSNIVTGVAGVARGAGLQPRVVAFHERGVQTVVGHTGVQQVLHALARLPAPEGVAGFRLTTDLDRRVTNDERAFLRLVAPVASQPAAPSLDQALVALQRLSPGPALVVAVMDGEVSPSRVDVVVRRLQRMGHQAVVVVPATGPHHSTKQDAPVAQLREAMARRQALARRMAGRGVPMVVAFPGQEEDVVREVARCAL